MKHVMIIFSVVFLIISIFQKNPSKRKDRVLSVFLFLLVVANTIYINSLIEDRDIFMNYYDKVSPYIKSLQQFSDDYDYSYPSGEYSDLYVDHAKPSIPGAYNAGQYKVGIDIPSGVYLILPTNGISGYFCISSDANSDDITVNDYFSGNSILHIMDDEYFKLSSCYAIPYDPNYELPNAGGTDGFFEVGVHIAPGEYKLEAVNGSGYYAIYSDLRHSDIIANDYFQNTSYISLSLGQYLKISGVRIVD